MPTARNLFLTSAAIALGFSVLSAHAQTVTFNVDSGVLYNADGSTPAADNSVLVLVVDKGGDGFQGPSTSQFATGNDVEVVRWLLSSTSSAQPQAGVDQHSFNLAPISGASGDQVALFWFPTVQATSGTLSSATPGAGTPYGSYTSQTPPSGDAWTYPSTGGTVDLVFATTAAGGTLPNSMGTANQITPVPEPALYGIFVGAGCLAVGAIRRVRGSKPS